MNKQIITCGIKRLFVSKDIMNEKDVLDGGSIEENRKKLKKIYHIKIKTILQVNEAPRQGYYVYYK